MMTRLVLGSTSKYRKILLERLMVPFEVAAPLCDEDELKDEAKPPTYVATVLARAKALSLRSAYPDAYVIGSDQLVDFEGNVLGKPGSEERAVEQLLRMRGRSHRLLTALAIACPDGRVLTHLDVHTLTMHALSEEEVRRYVAHDRPFDCAGSYKIESLGISLFASIQGEDFTAITGLPLMTLARCLRAEGFSCP